MRMTINAVIVAGLVLTSGMIAKAQTQMLIPSTAYSATIQGGLSSLAERYKGHSPAAYCVTSLWVNATWISEYPAGQHIANSGVMFTFASGQERSSVYAQMACGLDKSLDPSNLRMFVTYTDGTKSAWVGGSINDLRWDCTTYNIWLISQAFTAPAGKLIKRITIYSLSANGSATVNARISSRPLSNPNPALFVVPTPGPMIIPSTTYSTTVQGGYNSVVVHYKTHSTAEYCVTSRWVGATWISEYPTNKHSMNSGLTYTFASGKERSSIYGQMACSLGKGVNPNNLRMFVTYNDGTKSAWSGGTTNHPRWQRTADDVWLVSASFVAPTGKLIKKVTCYSLSTNATQSVNARIGSSPLPNPYPGVFQ
jgi:hypothetical protein